VPAAAAKQASGALEGTVIDATTRQPLKQATILAQQLTGGHKRFETVSNDKGEFRFANIPAGEWELTVSAEGRLTQAIKVNVASNATASAQAIALEEMESSDVIRVKGKRSTVHPDDTHNATYIDRNILQNVGNGNNLRRVIETAPGVAPDSLGNIVTRGEHNAVNYIVDGVQLPEAAGVLQQTQPVSPRSLQNMEVEVGGFDASEGGGPLGAVVKMQTLTPAAKPTFQIGTQLGGPIQGGINYAGSTALSQDPASIFNRMRVESSGNFFGSPLGLQAPAYRFRRDGRFDLNSLTKLIFDATTRDRFMLTAAFNETYLQQPNPRLSSQAGYRINEHDRQNYLIASYRHRFEQNKLLDEANLHVVNAFYSQRVGSTDLFNPAPIVNGECSVQSVAFRARRYNYALSVQGDVRKRLFNAHEVVAGFLSEIRPVRTRFDSITYNADLSNGIGFGTVVSPFTGLPGGPQFQGVGKYHGFRYIQSGYLEDTFHPAGGMLRRLTLNAGVRADVYHGVFGSSRALSDILATIPGAVPFNPEPFQRHNVTNAQASGRFAGTYLLTRTTVLRSSFSQVFTPPPVDIFLQPFDITAGPFPLNGIYNGAPRPLQAARGNIVDAGVEQQVGSRFAIKNTLFYKHLKNFGDSGVINNTVLYNRLTLAKQDAYGLETRLDLKPRRDATGLYGFVSNTVSVAKLRGTKRNTGGIWDQGLDLIPDKYVDHDRREVLQAALGWRTKRGLWLLADVQAFTGYKDDRNPAVFGPHPARVRPAYFIGLNCGYDLPASVRKDRVFLPVGFELRIQNLTNNVQPINLGSPYQGTRYSLPIRVVSGLYWKV
jgi:hypothetical protein